MSGSSETGLTYVDDEWKFSSDWAIPQTGLPALPRFIVDKEVMRDKKGRTRQGAVGRLTLVKKTGIVRSITPIHHEKTGAPRYLIQMIFYAVAPDRHYLIGRPAPANQVCILIGQSD